MPTPATSASLTASSINRVYSAGEVAALVAATLFASANLALEAWRPLNLPDAASSLISLLILVISTLQWARRPNGGAMLATFLPAIPLSASVLLLEGGKAGASAFAATAMAFQLRCVLLAFASRQQGRREAAALALECRMPGKVTVFIDNDIESEVGLDALREGHTFRLAAGQVVPADGLVTFGSGFIDEAFCEGDAENLKMKGMGSQVYAGTLNRNATLLVRATSVGTQTFLSRLSARARLGTEANVMRLLAIDGVLTLGCALLLLPGGPLNVLRAFLVASGASLLGVLARFEFSLAGLSLARRWLWNPGGLRRFAEAGMLVLRSESVLNEGRPKLVAMECSGHSDDAVLGMMAPLARKLETPAAFAVLQELRVRNIPLQPLEFYQSLEDGAAGIVASDEVRWISLAQRPVTGGQPASLGALDAFVQEHLLAGEEVHCLEREGKLEAALAFRDVPISGTTECANDLKLMGLPVLLVSYLPKRAIERLRTELGLEHAQGETTDAEVDSLMDRLSHEGLAPAWVQTTGFRPRKAAAVAALPQAPAAGVDFAATDLTLPSLAYSLAFARLAYRRLRSLQFWIFGTQLGLLLCLLGSDERVSGILRLGRSGSISEASLAIAGVLPGFLALLFAAPARASS